MTELEINTAKELKDYIETIERLEEEKKQVSEKIKEIYEGAEKKGFEAKIIKLLIKQRKKRKEEVEREESLLECYKIALERVN